LAAVHKLIGDKIMGDRPCRSALKRKSTKNIEVNQSSEAQAEWYR
jgi:hypothetical protein